MKPNSPENYYLNMKPKMIKDLGKMLKLTRKVLGQHFDESKVNQIIEESKCEYEGLIPQLLYIGGKKNIWTSTLVGGAQMLAIIRPLEREGLSVHEIIEQYVSEKGLRKEKRSAVVMW